MPKKAKDARRNAVGPRRPIFDPEAVGAARSRIMRSIPQKDTKPEVLVRKTIHAMGFRFRLHDRNLPSRPDIVLRCHKAIIQVHGCFWHQHGCSLSSIPRTRTEYWLPKLARNVERDAANVRLLEGMGWRVLTVWECDLKEPKRIARKLKAFILSRQTLRKPSRSLSTSKRSR
ncbi:very short patch repair endonuclease [Bradyrhizobium stylosanthis]|uniref:very short patch repair endonuclease n=1 Tax=Bradyrhizobium stylosanthis TaxID=1803665 RepID=UPI0009EDB6FF|nr:very short patch repair endonuclease [Bradyrhizobium stylosanthis]